MVARMEISHIGGFHGWLCNLALYQSADMHAKPTGDCDPVIHLNCADLRNGALELDKHP